MAKRAFNETLWMNYDIVAVISIVGWDDLLMDVWGRNDLFNDNL